VEKKNPFLNVFRKQAARMDAKAKEKAAKAAKSHTPTHSLSMFVGTVSRLVGVEKGSKLRLTLKILGSKSKLDFVYVPGGVYSRVPASLDDSRGHVVLCFVVVLCVPLDVPVPVRAPEVQMHFPNPERQVAHITLKVGGNWLQKRVVGHASFPVGSAMGPNRRELAVTLTSFDDKPGGRITLKLRVQELGVFVEDWVALGQGLPSITAMPPVRHGLLQAGSSPSKDGKPQATPGSSTGPHALSRFRRARSRISLSPQRAGSPPDSKSSEFVMQNNPLMVLGSVPQSSPNPSESARKAIQSEKFFDNPMQVATERAAAVKVRRLEAALTDNLHLVTGDLSDATASLPNRANRAQSLPKSPTASVPLPVRRRSVATGKP
jgi:hypothetical protein